MLYERSRLAAADQARPRLVSPPAVLMLAGLAVAVLASLHPGDTLLQRVYSVTPGPLTDSYIAAMLRTDPSNTEMRLRFVVRQIRLGNYRDARRLLAPLFVADSTAVRQLAAWVEWQIDWTESGAESDAGTLGEELTRLLYDQLDEEAILDMAERALYLGKDRFALELLAHLARRSPRSADHYARFAQLAQSRGAYQSGAQLYLLARERVRSIPEQRRYFLAALHALQAGDRLDEALDLAEAHLGPLIADRETLLELARLARAAGRGDLASHYARLLVQLSLLRSLESQRLAWGISVVRVAATAVTLAQAETAATGAPGPGRPYDAEAYELAYTIFVENGRLEDAFRTAEAAVRARPRDLAWQQRFAQVAEWTHRPVLALDAWLVIAQRGGREKAWKGAWDQVYRLAKATYADDRLVLALQDRIAHDPKNPRWTNELAAAYQRLGRPEAAIAAIAAALRHGREPQWLRELAVLHGEQGNRTAEIRAWQSYLDAVPGDIAARNRLVQLFVLNGDYHAARQTLSAAPADARGSDWLRWDADLAWREGDRAGARRALRKLIDAGEALPADYERLLSLMPEGGADALFDAAEEVWRARRRPEDLQRVAALAIESARFERFLSLLKELTPDERAALLKSPALVPQIAAALARRSRAESALQWLLAAQREAPDLAETLLWAAIDTESPAAEALLQRLLAKNEREWQQDAGMHDVLAAAWLRLGEPRRAMTRYLAPQLAEHDGDFLWLMNYADVLDQLGDADRAWTLRRLLFQQRRPPAEMDPKGLEIVASARLAIARLGGDGQARLLHELLRIARSGASDPTAVAFSAAARDVALAWWIDAGEYHSARAWLWSRYARRAAEPGWAALAVAMAEGDEAKMGELLETRPAALPKSMLGATLRPLAGAGAAVDDDFAALAASPDDATRYETFSSGALAAATVASAGFAGLRIGDIDEQEARLSLDLPLGRPRLELNGAQFSRQGRNALAAELPDERRLSATLRGEWLGLDLEAGLGLRQALHATTPIWFGARWQALHDLGFSARVGDALPTADSTLLRLGGEVRLYELGGTLNLGSRTTLSGRFQYNIYSVQDGPEIDTAKVAEASISHTLLNTRHDVALSASWSRHGRRPKAVTLSDPKLDALLVGDTPSVADMAPEAFDFASARISIGGFDASADPAAHRRGIRPWADYALTHHSRSGGGYEADLGLAGSPLGADHLALSFFTAKNGSGGANKSQGFRLTYQHRY